MTKKAYVISDLHIDFYYNKYNISHKEYLQLYKPILDLKPDYLFIAGDISNSGQMTVNVLEWLSRQVEAIYFCFGNHDYVIDKYFLKNDKLVNNENYLSLIEQELPQNVYRLNGQIEKITENTTISGCMGIYDFSYSTDKLKTVTKEMMLLKWKNWYDGNYWGISTHEFLKLQDEQFKMIENSLKNKPTIMMTHMVPTNDFVHERYKREITTGFFNFDGKKYLNKMNSYGGKYWICGHTHDPFMAYHNNVQMICHPFGYPKESDNKVIYSPDYIINID